MKMKRVLAFCASILLLATACLLYPIHANAKALDEILSYTITADVQNDATVIFQYDVSWKVLDSKSEGPLSWVKIGIPNNHVIETKALSDNITKIKENYSGGSYLEIHFDRNYYEGDVVDFSYSVQMDYMYKVNPDEGYAEYYFTPGWFDDITVDNLTLRWNNEKADSWSEGCLIIEGYNVWTAKLNPGEKLSVSVRYASDAYGFDLEKYVSGGKDSRYDFSEHGFVSNFFYVIGVFIGLVLIFGSFFIPILFAYVGYKGLSGFKLANDKKITRTIYEYYSVCPNCGGSRAEGKENCSYCGTNMVKSKHEIKEEDIQNTDKNLLTYKTDGEYRFSSDPNRYIRVHVVPVPRPVTTTRSRSSSCAHSSCACACACACAGGGRAGCTTKDFYHTNLKLRYLKNKK